MSSQPVLPRRLANNDGCTCFLNAMIQSLSCIPWIRDSLDVESMGNRRRDTRDTLRYVLRGMSDRHGNPSKYVHRLRQKLGEKWPDLLQPQYHDAGEVFINMMNLCFEEEKNEGNNSRFRDNFLTIERSFMFCEGCETLSVTSEGKSPSITLYMTRARADIRQLLRDSIQVETMNGVRCEQMECARKAIVAGRREHPDGGFEIPESKESWKQLEDLPRYLSITVPAVLGWQEEERLLFPLLLDMSPFLRPCQVLEENGIEFEPVIYKLAATFRHHRPLSEHWTADVRIDMSGRFWIHCNDYQLSVCDWSTVRRKRPHNLVYDCVNWEGLRRTMQLYYELVRVQSNYTEMDIS